MNILIIKRDEEFCANLRSQLSKEGHSLVNASTQPSALEALAQTGFDIIILGSSVAVETYWCSHVDRKIPVILHGKTLSYLPDFEEDIIETKVLNNEEIDVRGIVKIVNNRAIELNKA